MNVENGWRFYSADFSVNATGATTVTGSVTLVRSPADVVRWHKITDELNADEYPELYVKGEGLTIEEAITNANLIASHLPELA